jgi:uncharacterized membrane protein
MNANSTLTTALVRIADRVNPITSGPAAPLKTLALFDSFGPSLMPRASLHQGMAGGVALLAGEIVGRSVDAAIKRVIPGSSPFAVRMAARGAVALAGYAVTRIRETEDEPTFKATIRTAGNLALSGAVGSAIYEASIDVTEKLPSGSGLRPIVGGLAGFAGASYYAKELLEKRQAVISPWTEDEKRATLPASLGIAIGVAALGRGIGHGFMSSRRSFVEFFGEDPAHAFFGRTLNAAIWAGGAAGLYATVVSTIARKNEKVEPAYATPPDSPYVSGGPNSISPFYELGLQGRRFVTDVVTPDLIEATLGEPAIAHPIRAFVGLNSEPLYTTGRSEMMLDELDRLGAFDRSYLLLVSPTGTGWVDQTMIESAELYARGDIATACIQYGRGPSFLEVQNVALGQSQFRGLLWGVKMRLDGMPPEKRPKVLVFGESLGSWSSSDVVMHQGIAGFDHYGIDRALWFGLVGLAKWSKTGMRQGSNKLVPPGTVMAFDNFGEYEPLTEEERERLRAVIVDHDNDPIAQMSFRWAVKRPPWLDGTTRGRNVPEGMSWVPVITFAQIMVDAMNAMQTVPGEFKSFGHDYRGDTADFVHAAYRLPHVTDEQKEKVRQTLLQLEVERGERIKNTKPEEGPGAPPTRTEKPRAWLRDRTPLDADEPAIVATSGQAPKDFQ